MAKANADDRRKDDEIAVLESITPVLSVDAPQVGDWYAASHDLSTVGGQVARVTVPSGYEYDLGGASKESSVGATGVAMNRGGVQTVLLSPVPGAQQWTGFVTLKAGDTMDTTTAANVADTSIYVTFNWFTRVVG